MPRARSSTGQAERGGTLRFVLMVALVAWVFRSLVFAPFSIPSGSMLPTLRIGDYLAVAKWPYGYTRQSFPFGFPPIRGRIFPHQPKRGDVVIFTAHDGREDLVKRVIGVPGDTVELRGGELILNGKPVARDDFRPISIPVSPNSPCRKITPGGVAVIATDGDKCVYPSYRETLPGGVSYRVIDQVSDSAADTFPATKVPPGRLFLMGDNRDDSLDSRFSTQGGGIGFVPADNVVGRAVTVFWSTDGSASYWKPWTWFTALRDERVGKRFSEPK